MDDFKLAVDGFEVSYAVDSETLDSTILSEINEIDSRLGVLENKAEKLNSDINRLTNNADWLDYTIAVASGILCGLIDTFFVGEIDLAECRDWGSEKINKFIIKVAGEEGDDQAALERAISKLEKMTKNGFPSDPNLADFGGGKQHHLRDFAHHPTLVGLFFSLLTQFTRNCYGTDTKGKFIIVPVKDETRIGTTLPQKLVYGTVIWFFHLVSDMAGTTDTAGKGTGIPGPILSLAKEMSVLPLINKIKIDDMELSQFISKLFNGTLFAKRDENGKIIKESVIPIDLRTELGVIKNQAMPVLINEVLVRTFYAIRRIIYQLKQNQINSLIDLRNLEWKEIIPFRNRTIVRMIVISSGTLMAVDMVDAAVHAKKDAAVGSVAGPAGSTAAFVGSFLLHVNFVGIGRFTIATICDVRMGRKREDKLAQSVVIYDEILALTNAKLYYKQASMMNETIDMLESNSEMWATAKDATEAINEMYNVTINSMKYFSEQWKQMAQSTSNISKNIGKINEKNPGLMDSLFGSRKNRIKE